jgi:hypothetical protein
VASREYRHFGVPEPVTALAVLLLLIVVRVTASDLLDYLLRKARTE